MPQITERGLGQMIHYVCKYTPVELLNAFGEECAVLEEMPENFEMSDQIAHANLCGFGKSVIQAVLEGKVKQLVLVNCCDSARRVYDIVESTGKCKFLYMLDLPHEDNECEKVKYAQAIMRLKKAYEKSYPYNCGLLLVLSLSYVVPPLICRKLLHTPFPVTSPAFYLINGIKSIDRYRNVITLKTARME